MSAHAYLSPSAAPRWTVCPGSARLCAAGEGVVDSVSSEAADQGTACHKMFQQAVQDGISPHGREGTFIDVVDDNTDRVTKVEITADMIEWVDVALRWLKDETRPRKSALVYVEERVHVGKAFGCADEMWGTSDIVINDFASAELVVADDKYGYNEVPARGNLQLLLYAIGTAEMYGWAHKHIKLVIIQPRSDIPVKVVRMEAELLRDLQKRLAVDVARALQPGAPLVPTEDGCKWCPAAGVCPALHERTLELARREFADIELLSREALVAVLDAAPRVEAAIRAARAHALRLLAIGEKVPGYKRVRSNKHRIWKDEARAGNALVQLGIPKDQVWKAELQFTPAQAEKKVGKAFAELLQGYWDQPLGDETLAPESDPRLPLAPDFVPEAL